MRKILMLTWVLIVCLNLIGCSNNQNRLDQATNEIEKKGGRIVTVNGYEIKEIDLLPDPIGERSDSIVYLFTDKKGKLDQSIKNNSSDTNILYGPYDGTDVFKITQSEIEVINDEDMANKVINGIEMEYKTVDDRIIIFLRSKGSSYTYEAKITENYTENKHFELFYEAISSTEF